MRLTIKKFLSNAQDETGFIVVTAETVQQEDIEKDEWSFKNPNVSAEVQIGDCTKKTYLDFCVYKESDLQKRLDKLSVMIDALQELKDNLPAFWQDAVKSAEAYKLIKEAEKEVEDVPVTGFRSV